MDQWKHANISLTSDECMRGQPMVVIKARISYTSKHLNMFGTIVKEPIVY